MRARQIAVGVSATGTGATSTLIAVGQYTHNAAAGSQVVAQAGVTTASKIFLQIGATDATLTSVEVAAGVPGAGQFTVYATAAPTANTPINYQVYN